MRNIKEKETLKSSSSVKKGQSPSHQSRLVDTSAYKVFLFREDVRGMTYGRLAGALRS